MDASTLYWLTRLPELREVMPVGFFGILLFVSGVVFFSITVVSLIGGDDITADNRALLLKIGATTLKSFVSFALALAVFSCAKALLPTKQDLAIIAGGYYVSNSEEISKLPENTAAALNRFLEEYNKPLPEDNKKNGHNKETSD